MYSPLVALIALNLDRRYPAWPLWAATALLASVLLYIYKWSMPSSLVLPALILGVGFFMTLDRFRHDYRMETRWMLLAAASLLAAFFSGKWMLRDISRDPTRSCKDTCSGTASPPPRWRAHICITGRSGPIEGILFHHYVHMGIRPAHPPKFYGRSVSQSLIYTTETYHPTGIRISLRRIQGGVHGGLYWATWASPVIAIPSRFRAVFSSLIFLFALPSVA